MNDLLLSVRSLNVGFGLRKARHRQVVHDVSFDVRAGECVALVGESGSGKSVTARSLVGLTGERARVEAARLQLDDKDLLSAKAADWRSIRGRRVGFVLQDALVSLDPLRPVGAEIGEALRLHGWRRRADRERKVIDLLQSVGVPEPEQRAKQRPGELSGGLRQRALIASAVALDPRLLIADEPTTALDVTVQAQVLSLLAEAKLRGTGIVVITHDLSVVAELADHVLVMKAGRVVEAGPSQDVLRRPAHEYTRALLAAVPSAATRGTRLSKQPVVTATPRSVAGPGAVDGRDLVLVATNLTKRFRRPDGSESTAVDDVSFSVERGTTLGIVGESGSGKSTTARIVLSLERPDAGDVKLFGRPWSSLTEPQRRATRPRIGVVYQDPLSSFDPRWNTQRIIHDALPQRLRKDRTAARDRIRELVAEVGLSESVLQRFPLQLSGGQRQRVAIARALATEPELLVLDEAVSALDVSVQAQILDLLNDLQHTLRLTYVFISHDLGVISHIADDVIVMKDGRIVEQGTADAVFNRPTHPYTQQLAASFAALPSVTPVEASTAVARVLATKGSI